MNFIIFCEVIGKILHMRAFEIIKMIDKSYSKGNGEGKGTVIVVFDQALLEI